MTTSNHETPASARLTTGMPDLGRWPWFCAHWPKIAAVMPPSHRTSGQHAPRGDHRE